MTDDIPQLTESEIQVAREMATPAGYAKHRLSMKLHPKQSKVLNDIFSRSGSRVVNRCANECGKTRKVLCAAILYAIEMKDAVCVSTAGTFRQIQGQLIPALKSFAHLYDPKQWDFQDCAIKRFDHKNKVWVDVYTGVSTDNEHFFQGYHKDEGRPLFIAIDECQGVAQTICLAAEDRCNPTWFLATGSPGDPQGAFYDMETSKAKHYTHHKINRWECLKEDGYWLERADVQRLIDKHGETNPFVQSTVFGEFSQSVEGSLLSLTEYDRCLEHPPLYQNGDQHAYMDFAAGRDKNVLAFRKGNRIEIKRKWVERDTMSAVGQFLAMLIDLKKQFSLVPDEVSGDADGLGIGMIHRLRELDWPVTESRNNAAPRFTQGYKNAVSEAWGELANKIKKCAVILPDDPDLKAQLLGRKAKRNSSGLLELESKEDMKKRGLDSPDEADAVAACSMPAQTGRAFNLVDMARHFNLDEQEDEEQESGGMRRFC